MRATQPLGFRHANLADEATVHPLWRSQTSGAAQLTDRLASQKSNKSPRKDLRFFLCW